MKKRFFVLFLTAGFGLAAQSCNHKEDDPTPAATGSNNSSAATPGAGWRVSLFTEPGEDKTHDYTGYTFAFAADGAMTATGTQSATGTWRQFQDDGVTKFEISLTTTDHDLQELNDDWVLLGKTDALITLQDDNSSSNEQLRFSK